MADDWIQPYQILQTIDNSTKFGDDFDCIFYMQYEHEGVEITISILYFQILSMHNWIDQRKLHHRTSFCLETAGDWTREYQFMLNNRISADLPHMEHIARTAANHQIPTTYGIQYNCSKFKLEYLSNCICFKFQQDAYFLSIVELNVSLSFQLLILV